MSLFARMAIAALLVVLCLLPQAAGAQTAANQQVVAVQRGVTAGPRYTRYQEELDSSPRLQELGRQAQATGTNNPAHCQGVSPNAAYPYAWNSNKVFNGQHPWENQLCPQGEPIAVCYDPSKGPRHWDQCDLDVVQARAVWCQVGADGFDLPGLKYANCRHLPICVSGSGHSGSGNIPGLTCRWFRPGDFSGSYGW